jgi:uncharacterized membrane protein (UPF0127 family)
MNILLAVLAAAFVAFCVWLFVRIVNRRERWAKWMLATMLLLPVLYVTSFGPACWISSRLQPSGKIISTVYSPVIRVWVEGPLTIQELIARFVQVGMRGVSVTIDGGYRVEFK